MGGFAVIDRRADLLDALAEVIHESEKAGISPLLIKGFHFAERFYSDIEARWTRDIDLLLPATQIESMAAILESLEYRADHPGWVPVATRHKLNHAINWERGNVAVDLHHGLRARPAYQIDNASLFSDAVSWELHGMHLQGLSDQHQFLLILLGLASDIEQGRVSAKQLMDFSMAATALDDQLDWATWLHRRQQEKVARVLCATAVLAHSVMPLSSRCPRLLEAVTGLYPEFQESPVGNGENAFELLSGLPHSLANRQWLLAHYEGSRLGYLSWWLLGGLLRPGSIGALLDNLRAG